jgi:hypothetical protein
MDTGYAIESLSNVMSLLRRSFPGLLSLEWFLFDAGRKVCYRRMVFSFKGELFSVAALKVADGKTDALRRGRVVV